MTVIAPPICANCLHLNIYSLNENLSVDKPTCDAFPEGIPRSVWLEGNNHKQAVKGDHGIRFERYEE